MSEIKRISIREFREVGFLQEANRQFFHPHGLALEVTTCTENDQAPAPLYTLALPAAQYERLLEIVGNQDRDLAERLRTANRYEVGDSYLSGVWDYREDPEVSALATPARRPSACEQSASAARRPATACSTGMASWRSMRDVEPVDWVYPE